MPRFRSCSGMKNPIATYRIQLHANFTFAHLEAILPYLKALGIKTIYASPITEATPGSEHGYDGVDPLRIAPDLGTRAELERICSRLHQHDMQWLQDIVPNHMAFHPDNAWLTDVLEKGPLSRYASYFDTALASDLFAGRIRAPFLTETPDQLIDQHKLTLINRDGRFAIRVDDTIYPLTPRSYATVLAGIAAPDAIQQLLHQLTDLHRTDDPIAYAIAWDEWREQLTGLTSNALTNAYIEHRLQQTNANPTQLLSLLDEQQYQLCLADDANQHINYRRFFTVSDLICLMMQNDMVFDDYHHLIIDLLKTGVIDGLRVDHVDGLFAPHDYLNRLRQAAGDDTYIVVEKILQTDEDLPYEWPVAGTTGYEFLAAVNNLLTDERWEPAFRQFYAEQTGDTTSLTDQTYSRKAYLLYQQMGGELENLTTYYQTLGLIDENELAELPVGSLKLTIGEWLIRFPVYRYFGTRFPLTDAEADAHRTIFAQIRDTRPALSRSVDQLARTLFDHADTTDTERLGVDWPQRVALFYQRCMQYAGPLMAKGVEDTLFYTNTCFIGHNEVGDSIERFGLSTTGFHQFIQQRQHHWPLTMNTTATHDTKRGEDVRARLAVLPDLADEWFAAVRHWRQLNAGAKTADAPDFIDEYLIYQSLLGSCPMPGTNDDFADRMQAFMEKALSEAKRQTDDTYQQATASFIEHLLDKRRPFWSSFESFHRNVADFGIINSLVQTTLRCTTPGVPDLFQGNESWDLSLVDPDNRRPVPYERRQLDLQALLTRPDNTSDTCWRDLWADRYSGRIKQWLTHRLLQLRQQQPTLFSTGIYTPLTVQGRYAANVLAFLRTHNATQVLIVVSLHTARLYHEQQADPLSLDWADTTVYLPDGLPTHWRSCLTDAVFEAVDHCTVGALFATLPVACLISSSDQ